MMLVNRRRRSTDLPLLPSLTVEIVRGVDRMRPIHAVVERLHPDTVVVRCDSGVDALAVAMSPELELHFHGPGLEVTMTGRPGRRVDDVHGSRSVELVLDQSAREVKLIN
jgi:hypothetical protein